MFGTPDSVIQIQNHRISQKKKKKDVWYTWFKWGLKSQLKFCVSPMPNLSLAFHLFLNPSRIQIRTQFFCRSQFITVTEPTFFISPDFLYLSSSASLPLSLSPLGHYRARTVMPDYPCSCEQNLRLRRGQCLQHLTNQIRKLYVLEPSQVQRQWACRPYLMGKRPIT